ncbi:MAG: nuclear transport factor 2 family protein [Planococcus donghaensis]
MFKTIQDVLTNYQKAVYEKDVDKFLLGYAEDVHIYDCWGEWEYTGTDAWRQVVAEWFNGLEEKMLLKVEFHNELVKESDNLAYVHSMVSYTAVDLTGKELRNMKNRFTFIMIKTQDSWQIIHEHSSLPINPENDHAIFG